MIVSNDEKGFRELVRLLEKKLGFLKESEFTCCGVTLAQCNALAEIGRADGLSLSSLAETLDLDASTVSRTVESLVKKRLAKRTADKTDRRYIRIELTDKGKDLRETIETSMSRYFKSILEGIPEDKRGQVLESLRLLVDAISEDCCK